MYHSIYRSAAGDLQALRRKLRHHDHAPHDVPDYRAGCAEIQMPGDRERRKHRAGRFTDAGKHADDQSRYRHAGNPPVVTYDKLEIIDVARRINTYETSILPFEDCCYDLLHPKNPATKPHPEKRKRWAGWDFEALIDECLEKMETVVVTPATPQEDDLF